MTPSTPGWTALAFEQVAVHRLDEVELEPLGRGVEPGVLDVADPGLGDRAAPRCRCGSPGRPPAGRRCRSSGAAVAPGRLDRDEAGQVVALGPEAVERPRPERGPDELRAARVQHQVGFRVGREVGLHAADDAQLVGVRGDLGEQLGDPEPALAALLELPGRAHQLRAGDAARPGRRLAVGRGELRLVVERIDVRRCPVHAEEDHSIGSGREMRGLRRKRRVLRARPGRHRRQAGERQVAEPGGDSLQQVATREPARIHRIDPPSLWIARVTQSR